MIRYWLFRFWVSGWVMAGPLGASPFFAMDIGISGEPTTGAATLLDPDCGGLGGLVLCGYQGWFRCEGDGSGNGWHHYAAGGKFEPGHSHMDLWPDVAELGPSERFATPFRHTDGRVAEVFSSVNEQRSAGISAG